MSRPLLIDMNGKYRVSLSRDGEARRFLVCRAATEVAAVDLANHVARACFSDVSVEVLAGRGRSSTLLYAVTHTEITNADNRK